MERLRRQMVLAQRRLAQEESGFTLIELMIVLQIIAILILTVTPSYLGFRVRAFKGTAAANVRGTMPSVQAYFFDHNSYDGMTAPILATYNPAIKITVVSGSGLTYCVANTQGGYTKYKNGPSGTVNDIPCS